MSLGHSRAAGWLAAALGLFVQRAAFAQTATRAAPEPGPAQAAPPATAPPFSERLAGPTVKLRADDVRTALQLKVAPEDWRDVCLTPCGMVVDPSRIYRVGGHPFNPSDPFRLPRPSGQVTIDAHLGSQASTTVGRVLTPVGLGVAVSGALVYWLGSQQTDESTENDVPLPSTETLLHVYGLASLVVGAGLAVAGAIVWTGNRSTVEVR